MDPYKIAKDRGIFQTIDSQSSLTTEVIVERIIDNRWVRGVVQVVVVSDGGLARLKYAERNAKKNKKEVERIGTTA